MKVRLELESQIRDGLVILTPIQLEQTLKNIQVSANCQGLPYAALASKKQFARELVKQVQGLALDLGTSGEDWFRQNLHHQHKPVKQRLRYDGYRVLGLSHAEGQLRE